MKMSRVALATIAVVMPLSVACSSSKDIAATDPSTGTTTSPTTTSTSPTEPTTPSVTVTSPTASGKALDGNGYTVAIPDGWEDITASLKASNPQLDVAMGEDNPSGFRTNFNVVNSTSNPGSIEDNKAAIRKEAATELKTITKTAVTSLPDRTIDGEDAIGQTSTFTTSGTSVTFLQYFTVHDGHAYPITMTFASANKTSAAALLEQILGTWHWTS